MAALTITPLDCEEADKTGVAITATLTDSAGNKIAGHVTGGQIVNQTRAVSNGATVTLDLTPNADIDPAGSYYTVKIGPFSFLIEKTSGTQTLRQALADDPVPLTPSVATQLVDAAFAEVVTDGEVTGPLDGLTIATGAVVAGKLGTSAVTTTKIQDDAVTTAKIATGAVTSAELGADSVTTAAIAPAAITTTELGAAAATTAKIDGAVVGYTDPLTDLTGWTDADTVIPVAYDSLTTVTGGVGVASPSSGAIGSATQGAGHGLRYKNLNLTAPCSVMVQIDPRFWPGEGGPALFVDLTTDEGWFAPVMSRDLVPPDPPNPYWWIGNGGKTNATITFLDGRPFTAAEEDRYLDPTHPAAPVWLEVRVDASWGATMWVDGVQISDVAATVPAALRGSTSHGFYVDVNATDENGGAGGARPGNLPVICGPFIARSLLPDATADAVAGAGETTLHAGDSVTAKGGTVDRLMIQPPEFIYSYGDVAQPAVIVRSTDGATDVLTVADGGLIATVPVESTDGDGRVILGNNGAGQTAVTVKGPTDRTLASIGYVDVLGSDVGGIVLDDDAGSAAPFTMVKSADNTVTLGGTSKITGHPTPTDATDTATKGYAEARANHTGTQTASTISNFDTAVRANRIDQMTAPAAGFMSWANGLQVFNGTAAQGAVSLGGSSLIGGAVLVFDSSTDSQPATILGEGAIGIRFGPGGASAQDWVIARTGAAAATITGSLTMSSPLTLTATNIVTDTTTGMKIGTATTQKIGFFNATPIVQASSTTDLRTLLINFGFLATGGASPLNLNGGALANGTQTFTDATNMVLGTTTGTKIGTATSQKLAFWNKTPIVQPTTAIAGATFVANAGTAVNDASTFGGYTLAKVVAALVNSGILA